MLLVGVKLSAAAMPLWQKNTKILQIFFNCLSRRSKNYYFFFENLVYPCTFQNLREKI
jgi:hypothetical protein